MLGGRIPGYSEHKDKLSASRYVKEVVANNLHDPSLSLHLSNGFRRQKTYTEV